MMSAMPHHRSRRDGGLDLEIFPEAVGGILDLLWVDPSTPVVVSAYAEKAEKGDMLRFRFGSLPPKDVAVESVRPEAHVYDALFSPLELSAVFGPCKVTCDLLRDGKPVETARQPLSFNLTDSLYDTMTPRRTGISFFGLYTPGKIAERIVPTGYSLARDMPLIRKTALGGQAVTAAVIEVRRFAQGVSQAGDSVAMVRCSGAGDYSIELAAQEIDLRRGDLLTFSLQGGSDALLACDLLL